LLWLAPAADFLTSGDPVYAYDVASMPFAVKGEGWDGPGLGSADLGWFFMNSTLDLPVDVQQQKVLDMMKEWSNHAALTWHKNSKSGENKAIDIGWYTGDHGDGAPFDGPGGTLAHGFYPDDLNSEPLAGDLHFDDEEDWTVTATGGGISLPFVALHELGHTLGLAHTEDPTAIMYPFYHSDVDPTPQPDDINAIQSIYGRPILGGSVGRIAFFYFNDGGLTAEDFTQAKDWLDGWMYSAVLDGARFDDADWEYSKDVDEDLMPDWWEELHGLNPRSANGINGRDGDPDEDGLLNYYEYLAGTKPTYADSDGDGESDLNEDSDGDSIGNGAEQNVYLTNPGEVDTDDNGIADGVETAAINDPTDSLSPYIGKVLEFAGGTGSVVVVDYVSTQVDADRYDLKTWTVELAVQPAASNITAVLLKKEIVRTGGSNYEIGLTNGRPYVLFDPVGDGVRVMVVAGESMTLPTDERTHIAARYVPPVAGTVGRLDLFINGELDVGTDTTAVCDAGEGDLIIGSSEFSGQIREIRIWKVARTYSNISELQSRTLFFGASAASAGYLRLNGNGLVKETATTRISDGNDTTIDPFIDELTEAWTIEAWVKTSDSGYIIGRRNNWSTSGGREDYNYLLRVGDEGVLRARYGIGEQANIADYERTELVGEIIVNDGAWHHVAYIRDLQGTYYLYVDGILDEKYGSRTGVLTTEGPLTIGENLTGLVDEVRVWNRALTPAELRKVMSKNLFGNEFGLISYISFDNQAGEFAEERATVRNPVDEYGIYIGDAELLTDSSGGAPIKLDPLSIFAGVSLVGYFASDDGGVTLEDYVHRMGIWPFVSEPYAGILGSNVTFATRINDFDDSDDDGLPDWWEDAMGLDVALAIGDDGKYGDPDHDGLINLYEYLAWHEYGIQLNPKSFKTFSSNKVSDCYLVIPSIGLTFGELYEDTDVLPDLWESQYPMVMDRHYYHRDQDPDGDEWNNQEEYLAGTVPNNESSSPQPLVAGYIQYNGPVAGASNAFHIMAYESADMDTVPVEGVVEAVDGVYAFSFSNISSRTVWLMAYKSSGGDSGDGGTTAGFNAGDAYGIAGPISISFDGVTDITVPVLDQSEMQWFPSFSWPAQTMIPRVFVQIKDNTGYIILRRWIHTDRNFFQAVDYMRGDATKVDNYQFGLPEGNSYAWTVASNDLASTSYIIASGSFNVEHFDLPVPEITSPSGVDKIVHQLHDFVWKSDPLQSVPQFEIQIAPKDGHWVYNTNICVQPSDLDGTYTLRMPLQSGTVDLFGSGRWEPGEYYWWVRSGNNSSYSSWSERRRFEITVTNAPPVSSGAPSISGNVIYHGKASASNIVIRAFKSPGYGGRVEGQATLTGTAPFDMDFTLNGLRHVTYSLMAFLDLNGNGICEEWEPQGLARDNAFGSHYQYRADAYGLGLFSLSGVDHIDTVSILIRDRDTDNDNVMDGWEWEHMHNSPQGITYGGDDDMDGDGLSNLEEYGLNSDPINADSDGDGLSDGDEINIYGSSPTNEDSDGDSLPDGDEADAGLSPANDDDDGDGVPTLIEVTWGGTAGSIGAGDMNPGSGDSDGDGVGDLMEIASGSDPVSASDSDVVSIGAITTPLDSISWNVGRNDLSVDVTYIIEYSLDMINWTAVGEMTDDGDSYKNLVYSGIIPPAEGGFYRLRLEIR